MNTETLKQARKAGIRIRTAKPKAPSMTMLLRSLDVGQCFTYRFSHKQAPHAFARVAGIKIETKLIRKAGKKHLIDVTRIA